jgi:hypothetical protein
MLSITASIELQCLKTFPLEGNLPMTSKQHLRISDKCPVCCYYQNIKEAGYNIMSIPASCK